MRKIIVSPNMAKLMETQNLWDDSLYQLANQLEDEASLDECIGEGLPTADDYNTAYVLFNSFTTDTDKGEQR
jgi:hypothetical protein